MQNCESTAEICKNCGAVTLPTRSTERGEILEWNVISPLVELHCPDFQVRMVMSFGRENGGGAVRVGEGQKKVLTVKDHAGVRTVSWSLKEQDGKKRTATRTWDNMGEEEWAEVRRLLEGVEGSMELVEVMPNI
jgi:hypothetical protein